MVENKQYRLACPYCGYSQIIAKLKAEGYKALTSWNINWAILQVRDIEPGPGRPSKDPEQRAYQMAQRKGGFPIDIENCMSILEMAKSKEWKDLASMVAARIETIYNAYREEGLIK
jgi:hypothetical protein